MPDYTPPVRTMRFLLDHVTPLKSLGRDDIDEGMVEAILDEAAKLASNVLAPLNWTGDQDGALCENGVVKTAAGFKEAYAQYRDGGWNAVPFDTQHGGQGLPWLLSFPIQEMWQGANLSFGLCPLLNQGAVDAIEVHGSAYLKHTYLEKLISGHWTGTMNLTEPQAGSDLSLLRTKATRNDDGTYKIFGQKIYITYGEHDLAENIIHLVLARLPDAPEGTRGISLFVVPKFLPDGTRNDVTCVSVEHKLGIHASPTCTMQFGDKGGATAWLVGQENEGLKCMFTMMNNARLSVGLQGVALSERATQAAIHYARERKQGKALQGGDATVAIADHADVKRMILSMQALTLAGRALTYDAAYHLDRARGGDVASQARVDLLTPIVKSWCTDNAVTVASLGVQVHGGMGFVEETGVAQYYRDARILPIYEGTNGIQANDLIFRKILRDKGVALNAFMQEARTQLEGNEVMLKAFNEVEAAIAALTKQAADLDRLAAVAVPFLNMMGLFAGGVMMNKIDKAAQAQNVTDYTPITQFYFMHMIPQIYALRPIIETGANSVVGFTV
jgi:3-(methylthio)propanoyl-CoA dehydrogenase